MARKWSLPFACTLVLASIAWASTMPSFDRMWGTAGVHDGDFSFPRDLVVNSAIRVYVADTGNQRIQVFDGIDGSYQSQWGSLGGDDGQFRFPSGIAVDATDHLYVADTGNDRVQVFSSSG